MFNLLANATVDDLSMVPEDFRPLYKQEGNSYVHNADLSSVIKAVSGMQDLIPKLRNDITAAKKAQVDLSPLSDFGPDPVSIAETVKAKMAELEGQIKGGAKPADIEKVRKEIQDAAAQQIKVANEARDKLEAALTGEITVGTLTREIAAAKGDPEMLLPFTSRHVKVQRLDDGSYKPAVVGEDGSVRYNPATGKEMTVAELVSEFKSNKKFGSFFASEAPVGGGTGQQPRPGQQPLPGAQGQQGQMRPNDKIAAGLAALEAGR